MKEIKAKEAKDMAMAVSMYLDSKGQHTDLKEQMQNLLEELEVYDDSASISVEKKDFDFIKKTTRKQKKSVYSKWF